MRNCSMWAMRPASAHLPAIRRHRGFLNWSPPARRFCRIETGRRWPPEGLSMWGIIPAAGAGSRIQPLAFSKELLPVGSRVENGAERPRAVSEYLVERMIAGGADKLCFV